MVSYAQPTIEKRPDRVCLHIGTNDLKSNDPDVVADNIRKLAQRVEDSCGAEISVSELTTRNDTFKGAAKQVNKQLADYCKQNDWNLIRHQNISIKSLNRGGLHLTKSGNELLFKNFVKHLKNWSSAVNAVFANKSSIKPRTTKLFTVTN